MRKIFLIGLCLLFILSGCSKQERISVKYFDKPSGVSEEVFNFCTDKFEDYWDVVYNDSDKNINDYPSTEYEEKYGSVQLLSDNGVLLTGMDVLESDALLYQISKDQKEKEKYLKDFERHVHDLN